MIVEIMVDDAPEGKTWVDHAPLAIAPNTSLQATIAAMSQRQPPVSYALIVDQGHLQGIITERDIVRCLARPPHPLSGSKITVSDLMTRQLITAELSDLQDLVSTLKILQSHHIRHLPILDRGQLYGIVTLASLRQFLQPLDILRIRQIHEVMTHSVIDAAPHTSLLNIATLMSSHQISCVVIVKTVRRQKHPVKIPVGIVTERDLVQWHNQDLSQVKAKEVMSSPVFALPPDASLWTVHEAMCRRGMRRVVIVGEEGELLGLVTQTSVLEAVNPHDVNDIIASLQAQVEDLQDKNLKLLQERNSRLEVEIRQREEAAAALQASEKRFRATFEVAGVGMALISLEGQLLEVNSKLCELLEEPPEQLLGKHWYELIADEYIPITKQQVQVLMTGEQVPLNGEKRYKTARGEEIWVHTTLSLVQTESGEPDYLIAVVEDIRDRKQREQKLRVFERAIAASPNGIIISDATGGDYPAIYVNPAFESLTGYISSDVLGRNFLFLQDQDTQQAGARQLWQALANARECRVTLRNYRRDGSMFWNDCSIAPVRDQLGKVTHYIGIYSDITRRREALESLTKQLNRTVLLRQITEKIRLSLDVNHIFNTAAEQLGQVLQVDRCLIHTYYPDPLPCLPLVAEYIVGPYESLAGFMVPIEGNAHVQTVLTQDSAVATPNVYMDSLFLGHHDLCQHLEIKSMLVVRTSYNGQPNGLICLHQCCIFREWNDEDIELIESVAASLGIAIAQASLLEQEKQQKLYLDEQNFQLQREIEQRERIEEQLHQTLLRLELVIEASNDGFWDWDFRQQTIYFSPRWKEMLGYLDHELPNTFESWEKVILPEDRVLALRLVEDYNQGKVPRFLMTQRFYHKDGSIVYILSRAIHIKNAAGEVVRMIGSHTDITETIKFQNRLQEQLNQLQEFDRALQQSEIRYRAIIEAIPDLMFRVHRSGIYLDFIAAKNSPKLFDHHRIGRHMMDVVPPEIASRHLQVLNQVLSKREMCIYEQEFALNGQTYQEEVRVTLSGDDEVLFMIRDISDRKRSEKALQAAKEAAEAANLAKSQFLATMSHELRTPLNAILGFSQILHQDSNLHPEQKEYLGIIQQSGEHLLDLINDILDLSKMEAGQISLDIAPFSLHELLDLLHSMFYLKAQTNGLTFTIERPPNLPQSLLGDASKLRQILMNLLSNSCKFTQQGYITLRVKILPSSDPHLIPLQFSVIDTGPGIAPQELNSIFEPFVQTEVGRNSQQGTGLGLPISRRFIELMGGDMEIESRNWRLVSRPEHPPTLVPCPETPPQETCFRFSLVLPVNSALYLSPPETQTIIGLAPHQPSWRILIVEDIAVNRHLLRSILSPLGFEIKEAENGEKAIALWQTWHPHLIWMDIRMPVMDGYEATQQIRLQERQLPPQTQPPVKIIALTASAFEQQRQAVLDAGCDDFLSKPFLKNQILAKMQEHLGVEYSYSSNPLVTSEYNSLEPELAEVQPSSDAWIAQLQQQPQPWLKQFEEAVSIADEEHIFSLIQAIPYPNSALAASLEILVKNFQFEKILEATAQSLKQFDRPSS
ncbi:PAS domain S-box protein [Spirulina subsalsa FACHB-351]|uniref:histidine kinase n=1 Tax=Spirulina subsalsa FACHB-351 TaxID=234711 RepID=A0ABT3L641_9CYAN|nr:PAS domain S-box protein [Spirulina subsalsa]MCW6036968.1 PAS domain S-box protein [Spirulina subsalsa FACHB-351]